MIFRNITACNVGPFRSEWSVDLSDGLTVVLGEYGDGEARSNRAGKSYFAVDCPMYALFGEFRGSKLDDLSHRSIHGEEDAWVDLTVEGSDGREWRIRRGRTKSGSPIRTLNGAKISDVDLQRMVEEEILGLTLKEYQLTNAFIQGEMHAFLKMSAAEKRRVVSPWFKTDRWIPRADLARTRLNAAKARLRTLEDETDALQERASSVDSLMNCVREAKVNFESAREKFEDARMDELKVRAELESTSKDRARREEVFREVRRLRERFEDERASVERNVQNAIMNVEVAKRALEEARGREERLKSLRAREDELVSLREDLASIGAELRGVKVDRDGKAKLREELLAKYRELTESRTGICPVLREECDRVSRDEGALEELKRDGLSARRAMDRLSEVERDLEWKLDMAKSEVKLVGEEVDRASKLRTLPSVVEAERGFEFARLRVCEAEGEFDRVKLRRTEIARNMKAREKELKSFEIVGSKDLEGKLEDVVLRVKDAREVSDCAEAVLLNARADHVEAERASEKLVLVEDEKRSLSSEISKCAWASYAFGSAGIPSRELENAFGCAEDAMNSVLSELGTPLRVRFEPTRELKEWEPACVACGEVFEKGERTHACRTCGTPRRRRRRDELRLEVDDGEHGSGFELDSGGGKVLLSLGVRLGLASLPGNSRRVRCEHLLIDEPDGALDEANRAALHALLRRVGNLGFRQVLLITHADVRREFSSAVTVRRVEYEDRSEVWSG